MKSMAKWMLGAAVIAGGLGLGTKTAQAAEFGVYIGGPAVYVPPCPGPGYQWTAGYYSGGYWVPGRWAFIGRDRDDYRVVRYYGDRDDYRYYHRDRDDYRRNDWDRDRNDWDHDRRDWDRDHHDRDDRGRDRDHYRR